MRRRNQPWKIRLLRSSLLAETLLALVVAREAAAQTPNVEQVIADFGFPANASERIRRGEVLESDPAESSDRELAIGLTFLVEGPPATVAKAFRKADGGSGAPLLVPAARSVF